MVHWRGLGAGVGVVDLPRMAIHTCRTRDRHIMAGESFYVRRIRGSYGKSPAYQHDKHGKNAKRAHRTAAHLPAVACTRGFNVKGGRRVGRWIRRIDLGQTTDFR